MPDDKYGTIAFAVPTLEAALGGMEDIQSFEVAIDDRTVLKIQWHNGLMARNKLRDCANGLAAASVELKTYIGEEIRSNTLRSFYDRAISRAILPPIEPDANN
ncbi:MAG: hypothetical protein KME17_13635 [Cyanosarcina radialis HA8281-LM2]|nr:hypothetical protein [Cyanosarcina radialis HA8281-LM2]